MQQYDHGGDIYGPNPPVLDFSISLNPVGPPRKVLEAAREAVLDWNRYPDPRCRGLRRAAALRHGVPEENILFGGGASDLIDRFLRAGQPGHALVLAPTFSEYRRVLEAQGCQIQEHALLQEKGFAATLRLLDAIRPGVELVFLCDPNNPTGRRMEPDLLGEVLDRCRAAGAFLAVDQCFLELSEGDPDALVGELDRGGLILFRALTKSYALAGLRLGYCLCGDRSLLEVMERLAPPWPVSVPAQAAGETALTEFPDWPRRSLPLLARERERLTWELGRLGLWVCRSSANFLLFQGPPGLGERLLDGQGILLRDCGSFRGLPDRGWYRIGLRQEEDNTRLIQALGEVLGTPPPDSAG